VIAALSVLLLFGLHEHRAYCLRLAFYYNLVDPIDARQSPFWARESPFCSLWR